MCTLNATDRAKSLIIAQGCLSLYGRASDSKVTLIALSMLCPIKISFLFMWHCVFIMINMYAHACRDTHTNKI